MQSIFVQTEFYFKGGKMYLAVMILRKFSNILFRRPFDCLGKGGGHLDQGSKWQMRENSETRTVGPRGTHPDGVRWGNAALLALPKSVCVLEELRSTLLSVKFYRENVYYH